MQFWCTIHVNDKYVLFVTVCCSSNIDDWLECWPNIRKSTYSSHIRRHVWWRRGSTRLTCTHGDHMQIWCTTHDDVMTACDITLPPTWWIAVLTSSHFLSQNLQFRGATLDFENSPPNVGFDSSRCTLSSRELWACRCFAFWAVKLFTCTVMTTWCVNDVGTNEQISIVVVCFCFALVLCGASARCSFVKRRDGINWSTGVWWRTKHHSSLGAMLWTTEKNCWLHIDYRCGYTDTSMDTRSELDI